MGGSRFATADPETLRDGRWSLAVEVVGAIDTVRRGVGYSVIVQEYDGR